VEFGQTLDQRVTGAIEDSVAAASRVLQLERRGVSLEFNHTDIEQQLQDAGRASANLQTKKIKRFPVGSALAEANLAEINCTFTLHWTTIDTTNSGNVVVPALERSALLTLEQELATPSLEQKQQNMKVCMGSGGACFCCLYVFSWPSAVGYLLTGAMMQSTMNSIPDYSVYGTGEGDYYTAYNPYAPAPAEEEGESFWGAGAIVCLLFVLLSCLCAPCVCFAGWKHIKMEEAAEKKGFDAEVEFGRREKGEALG
jgi:hypothetical protein